MRHNHGNHLASVTRHGSAESARFRLCGGEEGKHLSTQKFDGGIAPALERRVESADQRLVLRLLFRCSHDSVAGAPSCGGQQVVCLSHCDAGLAAAALLQCALKT